MPLLAYRVAPSSLVGLVTGTGTLTGTGSAKRLSTHWSARTKPLLRSLSASSQLLPLLPTLLRHQPLHRQPLLQQGGTVIGAPAPAVSVATAEAMETATTAYVERLEQLNETLQKVEQLSARLATDSEEMENLNRTLTGIARVYEMQLKSASQQITTQDSINEQTQLMADKIRELNSIYARMIEAMTTNMPKA